MYQGVALFSTFNILIVPAIVILVPRPHYNVATVVPVLSSPSQVYAAMKEVQSAAEKLPRTAPSAMTLDPFSPPSTPVDRSHPEGENPFVDGNFTHLMAEQFHGERFEDFQGDPFAEVDPFAENGQHHHLHSAPDDAFVESDPPVSRRGGQGARHDEERGQLATLEEEGEMEEISSEEEREWHVVSHKDKRERQVASREETREIQVPTHEEEEGERQVVSREEVHVVMMEQPVLQLPKAVDVVETYESYESSSSQVTSTEDEEMTTDQVSTELENLTLVSQQFLKESEERLEEQRRRNLPDWYSSEPSPQFGMDEYKQASLKGLSATIQQMERASDASESSSERSDVKMGEREKVRPEIPEEEVEEVDAEEGLNGGEQAVVVTDDVISHLEYLEAEILSALDFGVEDPISPREKARPPERTENMTTHAEMGTTKERAFTWSSGARSKDVTRPSVPAPAPPKPVHEVRVPAREDVVVRREKRVHNGSAPSSHLSQRRSFMYVDSG